MGGRSLLILRKLQAVWRLQQPEDDDKGQLTNLTWISWTQQYLLFPRSDRELFECLSNYKLLHGVTEQRFPFNTLQYATLLLAYVTLHSRNRDSSVGITTRLRAEWRRNLGLILGRSKRLHIWFLNKIWNLRVFHLQIRVYSQYF
jgi:hypothetical protein